MKKTAVLLDGGFLTIKLKQILKRFPTPEEISKFSLACLIPNEELFRVYYYDCPPYESVVTNPLSKISTDFSKTPVCQKMKSFQDDLSTSNYIAFRRGKLSFKGWTITKYATDDIIKTGRALNPNDLRPDLEQKRVDIKIGLDVAWLSSKKIVDRIILVSGDSDLIPAMKFARQEGIQVILVTLKHGIKKDMVEHCDELREVNFP